MPRDKTGSSPYIYSLIYLEILRYQRNMYLIEAILSFRTSAGIGLFIKINNST